MLLIGTASTCISSNSEMKFGDGLGTAFCIPAGTAEDCTELLRSLLDSVGAELMPLLVWEVVESCALTLPFCATSTTLGDQAASVALVANEGAAPDLVLFPLGGLFTS